MTTASNPIIANLLVLPIDGTAAAPSISFGGSIIPGSSSGTGIYGSYGQMNHAINGTAMFSVNANGVKLSGDLYILNGATAPVNGTTGDDIAGKGSIYIALDTGLMYQNTGVITNPTWTLIESGSAPLGVVITGFVSGAGTVTSSDTILTALNKLNGNQVVSAAVASAALPSASFTSAAVTAKLLTGLAAGADTTILSTDTILEALAKLQAQIDAIP